MSFFPDIDENGQLQETPVVPETYTPPVNARAFVKDFTQPVHLDSFGTKQKVYDKPTMSDMHECVQSEELQCVTCGRDMIV